MSWYTYIVECSDGSYYVGITNDLDSRVAEHNAGKGASCSRLRRPVRLRFAQSLPNKSEARKREIEIKGWRRAKKQALFPTPPPPPSHSRTPASPTTTPAKIFIPQSIALGASRPPWPSLTANKRLPSSAI